MDVVREKPRERERRKSSREEKSREGERQGLALPNQKSPPLVVALAVHGSGEKLEGPAMEALVRSWRKRLGSFHERGRKKP